VNSIVVRSVAMLVSALAALPLGACAERDAKPESKPSPRAPVASGDAPAAAAPSASGTATASTATDAATTRVRSLVAEVVARAGGKARGPELPLERAGSLVEAREHAGKTFVSADGTCLADDHVLSVSIGSGNAGNTPGACPTELLNPVAPDETGETKPLFLTAGRMLEVTPAANFSYWQEVKVKTDKGGSCLARVGGNSRFGLPQYAAGQKLEYRQQIRGSGEGDTASYHLLRSEEGEVLWADYSGTLRRHANEGPPRIALEIVPDASPTCQRRYDVKNPLPHIAFGLTFRTPQGECHLDPLSSALCKLWGKPYRVVIDQFGGDTLNYAIVKDELFRPQAEVSESITKK